MKRARGFCGLLCGLWLGGGAGGCEEQHPALVDTVVVFHARASHELPVAGVEVRIDATTVGRTDANGDLRARLSGVEGTTFALSARCPVGFDPPPPLPSIVLGRYGALGGQPNADFEVKVACASRRRTLAVVLRTRELIRDSLRGRRRGKTGTRRTQLQALPGLPVLYAGKPIATTDDAGLAHLALDVPSRGKITLALDTTGANRHLRPQSPTITLELREEEDIFLVDQMFAFDRDPPPVIIRTPPKRHVIKILRDGMNGGMIDL